LIQIIASFSVFNISQGSVVTYLMYVGILFYCKFPAEYVGEKNYENGQYLATI